MVIKKSHLISAEEIEENFPGSRCIAKKKHSASFLQYYNITSSFWVNKIEYNFVVNNNQKWEIFKYFSRGQTIVILISNEFEHSWKIKIKRQVCDVPDVD